MLETLVVILAGYVVFRGLEPGTTAAPTGEASPLAHRPRSPRLVAAVTYADQLFAAKKWLAAEKAYVEVLKHDHKNLTAYSHLGIIYSTQRNHAEAIECFQIAIRLKPSGSTYQNLAMAYYENRNYIKSIAAYDKSLMFEPTASRYIGLSKAYRKVSDTEHMIGALESAVEVDGSERVVGLLRAAYVDAGRVEKARSLTQRFPIQPQAETSERHASHA